MARKKKEVSADAGEVQVAEIINQPITDTIEKNFMPYAMSVIVSRAIPEIDGFKPAHRKLLYTMYKMGLLTGARTKSANIVGETMKLNPHGDASIYETLVRLTRGNDTLLHPFIDSKGSFGKHYSSSMKYSAPRYTEAKLDPFCAEIFRGIEKNAVDMVDNYDSTTTEPALLPTTFPNILVSPNLGIAVGMGCSVCSFNLAEICDGTIQLLKDPNTPTDVLLDIIRAPDFSCGANMIYDREQFKQVFETGSGPIKLRARYTYDSKENCIEVLQIPYSTTIELIMSKLTALIKDGRLKEVSDFRDEIDLSGFKLTLDLRRGVDPDKLMAKLFKLTPLEDSFDCNFNILIDGTPKQLGVRQILLEWIRFRTGCVRRELTFDLGKKQERLHLLLGLGKILLDIDKAIKIVRETKLEKDVIPNLMEGFSIDQPQAEFIAEIKLRNLNREYIINRIKDIETLQAEIADLEKTLASETRMKSYIARQLKEIKEKYGKPRRTQLIYGDDIKEYSTDEQIEDYTVRIVFTREGYFKKITMQSLRGSDDQKLKEGDEITVSVDAKNSEELLFFSDRAQVYKAKVSDFDTCKASQLGDYIPAKLGFDEGERVLAMKNLAEYKENADFVFIFKNGKGVRIPVTAYQTKANRRKLTGAYSDVSPALCVVYEEAPTDILIISNTKRALSVSSELIPLKTTRSSQGVALMTLKKGQEAVSVMTDFAGKIKNPKRYSKTKLPSSGTLLEEYDIEANQVTF